MSIWNRVKTFFGGKSDLGKHADRTFSADLKCGDRVRTRDAQRRLGTVYQQQPVDGKLFRVPCISVRFDDGGKHVMLPAENYTKATRY